jgi:hypothetical protein
MSSDHLDTVLDRLYERAFEAGYQKARAELEPLKQRLDELIHKIDLTKEVLK